MQRSFLFLLVFILLLSYSAGKFSHSQPDLYAWQGIEADQQPQVQARDTQDYVPSRWFSAEGRQPTSYLEWLDKQPAPADLAVEQVYDSLAYRSSAVDADLNVVVLVNADIYQAVETKLDTWIEDVEAEGWTVSLFSSTFPDSAALRAFLAAQPDIDHCFLIGDFPVPWYEINDLDQFPIDLYYMDLDGVWEDLDDDGLFDRHSGSREPEIGLGRLTAGTLTFGASEVKLLQAYFDRNHAYRNGSLTLPARSLLYSDDDWAVNAFLWGNEGLGMLYEDLTVVYDAEETRVKDYSFRLKEDYEWIQVHAHASPWNQTFAYNNRQKWESIYYNRIYELEPDAFFYNLYSCSASRYIESNYIGGWYIFAGDHGLAAVGTTKSGGMHGYNHFYGPLAQGKPLGEGFRYWIAVFGIDSPFWHYGAVLLGDPTLEMRLPEIQVHPAAFRAELALGETMTSTLRIENSGNRVLSYDALPVDHAVAIFDHEPVADISYWPPSSGNANSWSAYQTILEDDPHGRFFAQTVDRLDAETLADFDRLILPDNGVPDSYLEDVDDWFTTGKRIIVVDSAASYAAYAGYLWPDAAGSHGYGWYWNYPSGENDQEILTGHQITAAYAVGDIIGSVYHNAQMFADSLPDDAVALTAKQGDKSLIYAAARQVPGKGMIVALGPFERNLPPDTHALVRDAVGSASMEDWLSVTPVDGELAAGDSTEVEATFDSGAPTISGPGVYQTRLIIRSRAPDRRVIIPVELDVYTIDASLTPAVVAAAGDPGRTIEVTLTLQNNGSTDDTYAIALLGHAWLSECPDVIGPLAAGESEAFTVRIQIPADALAGEQDELAISVYSQGMQAVVDTAQVTTIANMVAGVDLVVDALSKTGAIGEEVTYYFTVINDGNHSDTYDIAAAGRNWSVMAPSVVGPLAPGEAESLTVTVQLPARAADQNSDLATVSVVSQSDPAAAETEELITTVSWRIFAPSIAGR